MERLPYENLFNKRRGGPLCLRTEVLLHTGVAARILGAHRGAPLRH